MNVNSNFFNHAILEIDSKAVEHNFKYFKQLISPNVKIMAMVKSNAYGLGAVQFCKLLSYLEVDYLGVAYSQEAIELRNNGITTPILVMNTDQNAYRELINYNVEPTLYNFRLINLFGERVQELNYIKQYPVHIEINTGMNRLGFSVKDLPEIFKALKNFPKLKIKSVFSHFATSDIAGEEEFTHQQIEKFNHIKNVFIENLKYEPMFHISNSAGATNFPTANYDMIRIGIGLYGISPYKQHQKNLKPVAHLKSYISQIHEINKGESVSYGRKFIAEKATKTATISVGYGDGIPRLLGENNGRVFINGKYAPIIGIVCMDMLMIDITGIKCNVGDEVTIFGHNPKLSEVAINAQTIPYEILTSITNRVKRIYI